MEKRDTPLKHDDASINSLSQLNNYKFLEYPYNIKTINLLKKIKIKLFGYARLGNYKLEGWKNPLPFYAFKCEKHGLQITYTTGWEKKLICNKCILE